MIVRLLCHTYYFLFLLEPYKKIRQSFGRIGYGRVGQTGEGGVDMNINGLKRSHFFRKRIYTYKFIIHHIFSLARDWSKRVT